MFEIKVCDADFSETYADLHGACFEKAWNESMMRQTLLLPGALGLIAYEDEKPAGFVLYAFSAGQADIITLGVVPEFRGKRISDEMMRFSFTWLFAQGVGEIFLEVAVDNLHAIDLYGRLGFEQVGRRPKYYQRGAEKVDALVMRAGL